MQQKWIQLSVKCPPRKTPVIVTDGKDIGITELFIDNNSTIFIQLGRTAIKGKPTHWMPCPELP